MFLTWGRRARRPRLRHTARRSLRRDLGNERGIMRWDLRDDGCPWRCSRWRSALSPAARPPARFPATRAGDFSRARAGIDQKIVALRARSESCLKSNAGDDQHIAGEMFGATAEQGRLRAVAWCRQSRHARLGRIQNMQRGPRRRRSRTSLPPSSPRERPDVVRELLAMKRHRLNACEMRKRELVRLSRINSGATVFRESA
jgi:hypothetical protein